MALTKPSPSMLDAPKMGTENTTTGGTSIEFTGIPAGTRKIVINFVGLSFNTDTELALQLGDSGGFETTGYVGFSVQVATGVSPAVSAPTGEWRITSSGNTNVYHGFITLFRVDAAGTKWTCQGISVPNGATQFDMFAGSKTLSAELDRVRLKSSNGTATFDVNGGVNIQYS